MKFFSIVLFLAFCGCYCDYTQQQEENAKKTADGRAFYERGKGTPAEYITNQRGMLNGEGKILRGESNGDYSRAVRLLSQLYEDAERGFCWKEPPASVNVPRTEGGFLRLCRQ